MENVCIKGYHNPGDCANGRRSLGEKVVRKSVLGWVMMGVDRLDVCRVKILIVSPHRQPNNREIAGHKIETRQNWVV